MSDDVLRDLIRSRPGGSGAFGRIPILAPREDEAVFHGAENLVNKTILRLHDGDEEAARRAVAHAARLGWCADEAMAYGVIAARAELFDEITDSLEEADPTEWAWRDACLAVLEDADELQAEVLRGLLAAIVHDYQLPARGTKALRRAIGDVEPDAPPRLTEQSELDEVIAVIWAMVTLTDRIHRHIHH